MKVFSFWITHWLQKIFLHNITIASFYWKGHISFGTACDDLRQWSLAHAFLDFCFRCPFDLVHIYVPTSAHGSFIGKPSVRLKAMRWLNLFSWISPLLRISHKQKSLHHLDLYDLLPRYQSVELTDKLENNWFDHLKCHPQQPSLLRVTIQTMGWKPVLNGLLLIPLVSRHRDSAVNGNSTSTL